MDIKIKEQLNQYETYLTQAYKFGYLSALPIKDVVQLEEIYKLYSKEKVNRNCHACVFKMVRTIAKHYFEDEVTKVEDGVTYTLTIGKNGREYWKKQKDCKYILQLEKEH